MDYEDFLANDTDNTNDYLYEASAIEIAFEVLQFVICSIGTTVDILMIYIILHYKNMRKPVNIYILNWLITDAMLVLFDPAEYRLYMILEGFKASKEVFCLMHMSVTNIRTQVLLFMLVLAFHWFFNNTKVTLFERHCGKVVAAVWTFGFIQFLVVSMPCFVANMPGYLGDMFQAFMLLVFIICLVTIHCMRRCANPFSKTSSLSVAVSTSFALAWIAMLIMAVLFRYIDSEFSIVIFYRGQVFLYLYPLVIFYLFYRIDPKFAACTKMLFRRSEDPNACFEDIMDDEDNAHQVTNSC